MVERLICDHEGIHRYYPVRINSIHIADWLGGSCHVPGTMATIQITVALMFNAGGKGTAQITRSLGDVGE